MSAGSFNLRLRDFNRRMLEQGGTSVAEFADEVVAEAKRIAPVDTGRYQASIRKDRMFSLSGAIGSAFGLGQGAWAYYVVSDVPYAEALEFGHSQRQAPHGVFGVAVSTVRARYGLR